MRELITIYGYCDDQGAIHYVGQTLELFKRIGVRTKRKVRIWQDWPSLAHNCVMSGFCKGESAGEGGKGKTPQN